VLRLIEWAIVLRAKREASRVGTHLHEFSIFRSQQMNEVHIRPLPTTGPGIPVQR